jgi:hypothetical protein
MKTDYTLESLRPLSMSAIATPNPAAVDQSVTFTPAPPPVDTTDLYGYWPLDEVSGTRAKTLGSATSADLAPLTVGVPSTAGRYGLAAQCVPAGFGNSPVLRNAALNPTLATDAGLTIAIWFKNQTLHYGAITESLFGLGRTVGNGSIGFFRSADTAWVPSAFLGDVHFMWIIDNAGTYNFTSQVGLGPFTRDVWHLAVIRVNSDGTFDVRIDGSTKEGDINTASYASPIGYATGSFTSTNYPRSMGALQLFNVWAPTVPVTWDYWHGEADDLRIWTRALTDAEIEDLWAKASPSGDIPPYTYLWDFGDALPTVNQTGLYGYWPLDEASGTRFKILGSAVSADLLDSGGTPLPSGAGRFGLALVSTDQVGTKELTSTVNPAMDFSAGGTIALWFNSTVAYQAGFSAFVTVASAPATSIITINKYFDGPNEFLSAWASAGGEASGLLAPASSNGIPYPSINEWHLLVLTADPTAGRVTLYLDDRSQYAYSAFTGAFFAALNNLTKLSVNQRPSVGWELQEGKLDDLRIWTRVLTDAQIADLWYRSDEETPAYSYGEAGTQTISATVTSAHGCVASRSIGVVVS